MKKDDLMNYEKKDISIAVEKLCKKGFFIILPIVAILLGAYYFIHGWYDWSVQPWTDYFIIMGMVIVGYAIHEFIHALGWVKYSEGKWKSMVYGYDPNYLKPYLHPVEGIKIKQYIIIKILPLIITGLIPYIIGMALGNFHITVGGICLIGMCGVDIATVIKLMKEDKDNYILSNDNPSKYLGWVIKVK